MDGGLKKIMQYQFEEFNLQFKECIGSRCWEMNKNIWGDLLTENRYLIVPRELRLKRRQLGLNNEEYAILLDYLDYFKSGETESPYQHMAELNGVSEKTIERRLATLEKKGLLKKEVRVYSDGKIKGVAFSPEPLVRKLKFLESNPASAVDMKGFYESPAEYMLQAEVKDKKWKDEFCSTRWYNDVFSEMYETSSGQPVLTGGREYKSAETYFRRLKELNPALSDEDLYIRATEGARLMLVSA